MAIMLTTKKERANTLPISAANPTATTTATSARSSDNPAATSAPKTTIRTPNGDGQSVHLRHPEIFLRGTHERLFSRLVTHAEHLEPLLSGSIQYGVECLHLRTIIAIQGHGDKDGMSIGREHRPCRFRSEGMDLIVADCRLHRTLERGQLSNHPVYHAPKTRIIRGKVQ